MTDQAKLRPAKRSLLRFKLSHLFGCFLVLGIVMGWLHSKLTRLRHQRESTARIREMGGSVGDGSRLGERPATVPSILHGLVGDDFFTTVRSVRFGPGSVDTQFAACVAGFQDVESICIIRAPTCPLSSLRRLGRLKDLNLFGSQVEDLAAISHLTELRSLVLSETNVVDVTAIQSLEQLKEVYLDRTRVRHVPPLSRLTGLRKLDISNTRVNSLRFLSGVDCLQKLWLSRTGVVDVSQLRSQRMLEYLDLKGTGVVDATPIQFLPNLKYLFMGDCPVSSLAPLPGSSF